VLGVRSEGEVISLLKRLEEAHERYVREKAPLPYDYVDPEWIRALKWVLGEDVK